MPDREPLSLQLDGPVAILSLNRPAKRNALSSAMLETLVAHCESLASDKSVRVVLLSGEGSDFCAGADLPQFLPTLLGPDRQHTADLGRRAAEALSIGLISRVVEDRTLDAEVTELALTLSRKARLPVRTTKAQIRRALSGQPDDPGDARVLLEALSDPECMTHVTAMIGS